MMADIREITFVRINPVFTSAINDRSMAVPVLCFIIKVYGSLCPRNWE